MKLHAAPIQVGHHLDGLGHADRNDDGYGMTGAKGNPGDHYERKQRGQQAESQVFPEVNTLANIGGQDGAKLQA